MTITTVDRRTIFTSNGNGNSFSIERESTRLVSGQGSFDGGSLKLQVFCGLNVAGDTELWRDYAAFTALTAVGHQAVLFPIGRYRFVLSGATAPSIAALVQD